MAAKVDRMFGMEASQAFSENHLTSVAFSPPTACIEAMT